MTASRGQMTAIEHITPLQTPHKTKRRRTKGTGSIYMGKDGRVGGEYEVNGKLKDETELEALNDDLVGVVAEKMQPEHAGLWLRPPQDRTMQSKLGESEVEDV